MSFINVESEKRPKRASCLFPTTWYACILYRKFTDSAGNLAEIESRIHTYMYIYIYIGYKPPFGSSAAVPRALFVYRSFFGRSKYMVT